MISQKDSHSVLSSPFLGSFNVLGLVLLEEVSNFWNKRIIWVWVIEKRTDGEQHLGDGEGWRPLVLQDVQADAPLRVHVRVVHLRLEVHLGGLERVVGGELSFDRGGEGSDTVRKGSRDGSGSVVERAARRVKKETRARDIRAPVTHDDSSPRQIAGEERKPRAATGSATGGRQAEDRADRAPRE